MSSITFVPMEKKYRAYLHAAASSLHLKSKSQGNGLNRHPCLYRTSRTPPYNEEMFRCTDERVARRLFPRLIGKAKQRAQHKRQGETGLAVVSYRDGEIVGATAPELGTENRGRAMLEKMGWSSGTALGATNNKGILLPVAHTIKNTRIGLG